MTQVANRRDNFRSRLIIGCRARFAFACILAIVVVFSVSKGAMAQSTPDFFFETPGITPTSSSQGLSTLTTSTGGNFTLSVWYTFQPSVTTTYYGIDLFVGFDQSNQSGPLATPENGTVALGSGYNATTAVTNVNSSLTDVANQLAGGADPSNASSPSSAVRPYGLDIDLASGVAGFATPGATPVHLCDLTLNDAALVAGQNQSIVIYSSDPTGDAASYTTYLDDGSGNPGNFARPASSDVLTLIQGGSSMPEPSSAALAFIPFALVFYRQIRRSGVFCRNR